MRDTSDRIIYALLISLALIGGFAFVCNPRYEPGVHSATEGILNALSAVLGFKFGVHIPKSGDDSRTTTQSTTVATTGAAPPAAEPQS